MTRALLLFEDAGWTRLQPLTDLLPVPALRFGASDLGTRLVRASGLPLLAIEARAEALAAWRDTPALAAPASAVSKSEVVIANAAALPGAWLARAAEAPASSLWLAGGRIAGARLPHAQIAAGLGRGAEFEAWLRTLGLPETQVDAEFLDRPWDLMTRNAQAIAADLDGGAGANAGEVHPSAVLIEPARITIARGARVDALAVLDARDGPILLGADTRVQAHTLVQGPCVVGAGTELLGGVIGHSSIGPQCRIAGEVDHTIWQGWANKRHHGFVGHSVLGEWVNLGALTTTSDLKNTYGEIRVRIGGDEIATGTNKLGAIVGAHVKTGIGTLLPTGAVIGTGAHLFGGGRFAPKSVPAFAWWNGDTTEEHELERFLATARTAMSRRDRKLLEAEEKLLRSRHAASAADRP